MTDHPPLSFPDHPRSELDRALQEVVERAGEVMRTQGASRPAPGDQRSSAHRAPGRARAHRAGRRGTRRTPSTAPSAGPGPEAACRSSSTPGWRRISRCDHRRPPRGHVGCSGLLIDDPRPIRLRRHRRAIPTVGRVPGRASRRWTGSSACPIRVRDEVFGNLYLSNPPRRGVHRGGRGARHGPRGHGRVRHRERAALRRDERCASSGRRRRPQIASSLLDTASGSALPMLADELIARTTAERICIVVPGPNRARSRVAEARGDGAAELDGRRDPRDAHDRGHRRSRAVSPASRPGARDDDLADATGDSADGRDVGPSMFVALTSADRALGGARRLARRPVDGPLHAVRTRHRRRSAPVASGSRHRARRKRARIASARC